MIEVKCSCNWGRAGFARLGRGGCIRGGDEEGKGGRRGEGGGGEGGEGGGGKRKEEEEEVEDDVEEGEEGGGRGGRLEVVEVGLMNGRERET